MLEYDKFSKIRTTKFCLSEMCGLSHSVFAKKDRKHLKISTTNIYPRLTQLKGLLTFIAIILWSKFSIFSL